MVVQVIRVAVGGYQYLIVGKLPGCKLQPNPVNLLRCQVRILGKGLDKLEKLPLVSLPVLLLGGHHLEIRGVGIAVNPGYQTLPLMGSFSPVHDIEHGFQQRASGLLLIFDWGEGGHHSTSVSLRSAL